MRVITISGEFGSGGQELGRRIADQTGWDYYDRGILTCIARQHGLDEEYVDRAMQERPWRTIAVSGTPELFPMQRDGIRLLGRERQIVESIGRRDRDCIIVGRNADVFLRHLDPFSVFVCASLKSKLARCRREAGGAELPGDRELGRRLRSIDRKCAGMRALTGGPPWGEKSAYRLVVNTTDWEIGALAPVVTAFALSWFGRGGH